MALTVSYNGYTITDDWVVSDISRPKPEHVVNSVELSGADGRLFRGHFQRAGNVAITLAPKWGKGMQAVFDNLMSALRVDNLAKLSFSDEDGRYRMCVPVGAPQMDELWNFARIKVEFEQPDVALYGQTKTASVSTSSTSFTVGGTYPAKPIVASSNAVKSSSNLWGVRFDGKSYMRVPLEVSSAVSVNINADTRVAKANGSTSMITLDSDWAELEPGTHTARIDQGSGSATLSWVERWL